MKLGDNLKFLLEQYGITQKRFAHELDITPAALGNYIRNIREPDYSTLIKISDYFHVSIDFLLGHETELEITHEEETLINIFRTLTAEQREFYIEQGKIFLKQNNRKRE